MYVSRLNLFLLNIRNNLQLITLVLICINICINIFSFQNIFKNFINFQLLIQSFTFLLILLLLYNNRKNNFFSKYIKFFLIYSCFLCFVSFVVKSNVLYVLFFINFCSIVSICFYMDNFDITKIINPKYLDYFFLVIFLCVLASFFYPLIFNLEGINRGNLSIFYFNSPNKSGILIFFTNIFFFYISIKYFKNKYFTILILVLFLILSFLTLSRTHFFAFFLSLIPLLSHIFGKLVLRKNLIFIFFAIFFFIILIFLLKFFGPIYQKYFLNIFDMIISGRLITWLDKLFLVINSNLIGCGIGCHNINNDTLSNAFDNQYLKSIYEVGFIGTFFFYLFIFKFFLKYKNSLNLSMLMYFIISGIGYEIFNLSLSSFLFFFFMPYFYLLLNSTTSLVNR